MLLHLIPNSRLCLKIQATLDAESLSCLLRSSICAQNTHKIALCLFHKLTKINIFPFFIVSHTFEMSKLSSLTLLWILFISPIPAHNGSML